jgi:hypothetical protein
VMGKRDIKKKTKMLQYNHEQYIPKMVVKHHQNLRKKNNAQRREASILLQDSRLLNYSLNVLAPIDKNFYSCP